MLDKTNKLIDAYTSDKLFSLLEKIEDWLLIARKIRIDPEQFDIIHKELLKRNFTPAQMSIATLWIKFGKWALSKNNLELSDFFPSREQISHLESEYVSKEYHSKRITALKNEHDIEISKLRYELQDQRLSEHDIEQYMMGINRMQQLHDEIRHLNSELTQCKEKIYSLEYTLHHKNKILESLKTPLK